MGRQQKERGACENPVGLSMHDDPMDTTEYICVNIWCMLDWILSQNYKNTLPLHTIHQLARSAKKGAVVTGGDKICENSNSWQVCNFDCTMCETRIYIMETGLKVDVSQTVNE